MYSTALFAQNVTKTKKKKHQSIFLKLRSENNTYFQILSTACAKVENSSLFCSVVRKCRRHPLNISDKINRWTRKKLLREFVVRSWWSAKEVFYLVTKITKTKYQEK